VSAFGGTWPHKACRRSVTLALVRGQMGRSGKRPQQDSNLRTLLRRPCAVARLRACDLRRRSPEGCCWLCSLAALSRSRGACSARARSRCSGPVWRAGRSWRHPRSCSAQSAASHLQPGHRESAARRLPAEPGQTVAGQLSNRVSFCPDGGHAGSVEATGAAVLTAYYVRPGRRVIVITDPADLSGPVDGTVTRPLFLSRQLRDPPSRRRDDR
jgi:hypothetical protein